MLSSARTLRRPLGWPLGLILGLVLGSGVGLGLGPGPLGAGHAFAAPEPEPIPRRWEYRVEFNELRLACAEVPGQGSMPFYYVTFKVINDTGEDRFFAPSFELATDMGQIIRSGRDVHPAVMDDLVARQRNPLMQNEFDVQGLFLQGEENAREAIVIWPASDLEVDEITIYAAGFSGETRSVERPDNGESVLLRKTLMLRHDTPGELTCQNEPALVRSQSRWIMRAASARSGSETADQAASR